jgi:SAM-dependent methyltransferase
MSRKLGIRRHKAAIPIFRFPTCGSSLRQIAFSLKEVAMSIFRFVVNRLPIPARKALSRLTTTSYNTRHARAAANLLDIRKSKVLVVGANTGEDCAQFIKLGACEVHGLDVIPEVGSKFPHGRVTYHRQSIEQTDLPTGFFDLVYSVATMEHVPDIFAGYSEMSRLVKPSGFIYSVASPIWNSPYGHHMACFDGHPWVHLNFTKDEIAEYARAHSISSLPGVPLHHTISYMMHPDYFNRRSAAEYDAAIRGLRGIEVIENELLREDPKLLGHPLGKRALGLGFSADELLSVTHSFVARGTAISGR